MGDSILAYSVQFGTLLAVAMAATQFFTLKIGKQADPDGDTFIEKNGTRKPLHAFMYSFLLGIPAAYLGLVTAPEAVTGVFKWGLFLAFMSLVVVLVSTALVKGSKGIRSLFK